jgi:hypothetical protein
LSARTNALFEAFRDSLNTVQNQGFPVVAPAAVTGPASDDQLRDLARAVDERFAHYYALGPMGLFLVGNRDMQDAFDTATAHGAAIVGRIYGDHSATPIGVLGQMVWLVVKETMSGVLDAAMRELRACAQPGQKAAGLEAVARASNRRAQATLLIEDDYHMRGSVGGPPDSPVITPEVDVRATMDDVVDEVIERVLQSGGRVVFTPTGSLSHHDRIVLLTPGTTRS